MFALPKTKELGTLSLVEMLIDYEGPQLAVCRNERAELFLASLLSAEDDREEWLYTPISESRFKDLVQGRIDTRTATIAEPNRHYVKIVLPESGSPAVTTDLIRNLDTSDIPVAGGYLTLPKTQKSSRKNALKKPSKPPAQSKPSATVPVH
ncbi:MAG TPA: DUF6575 domain-containing protein [Planctomycetota bacterium]|nr:DUF6575 domain-containing protein [Planctomycetota bacterium]